MRTGLYIAILLASLPWLLFSGPSRAAEDSHALNEKNIQIFTEKLQKNFPGLSPDLVSASPVAGVYEVIIGAKLLYITEDARYLLDARIIDLNRKADISTPRINAVHLLALRRLGTDRMIRFDPPKDKTRYTVTVFTDLDCPYCRKMHAQIAEYNALGIAIHYLLYPRAGLNSPSYHKAVSVWCSDDRKAALTKAKTGAVIPAKTCDNPVVKHMALGEQMGIRGTPSVVFPNGEVVMSYIPPKKMIQMLEVGTKAN
jgi:thiol:disulfide interchange protein DsbC